MNEVSQYLKKLDHPFKKEIQSLRKIILAAHPLLEENIKWNGPNFQYEGEDRFTLRIHPPPQLQLILHRGAKALTKPKGKLIEHTSNLLTWKDKDRAVITFKNMKEIITKEDELKEILRQWLEAASC